MIANLHSGFISRHLTIYHTINIKIEQFFRKVIRLESISNYYDKKNLVQQALDSLTIYLNETSQNDSVIEIYRKSIDIHINKYNETLLIYSIIYSKSKSLTNKLIDLGCDPFKRSKNHKSAFYHCLNKNLTNKAISLIQKYLTSKHLKLLGYDEEKLDNEDIFEIL